METSAALRTPVEEVRPRASHITFHLNDRFALQEICGEHDRHISYIEKRLSVEIGVRGNEINIRGPKAEEAQEIIRELNRRLECEEQITDGLIDACIRSIVGDLAGIDDDDNVVPHTFIKTRNKTIVARNPAQARYMHAIKNDEMVFGLGPAGTGKTYLAVAQAVAELMAGNIQKLIFSRPAVEAGEKLGFLPGDLKEKVDPYLRPIYDALFDCMPAEQVERRIASGEIEVAPLAFMRGRTLANAFIILDEAQNTTREQMKMFLTRFGEGSRMVICGDPRQTDIPGGPPASGLTDAIHKLEGVEGITFAHFTGKDVVRHAIVGRIVEAYEGEASAS